jgi:hypothetical protein
LESNINKEYVGMRLKRIMEFLISQNHDIKEYTLDELIYYYIIAYERYYILDIETSAAGVSLGIGNIL